jgi:hypothetical protein
MNTNNGEMTGGEFVFFKSGGTIQSGGYSVNSLFLNQGISPITTINQEHNSSSSISDMFKDLAVPSWVLSSAPAQNGGSDVTVIDGGAMDDDLHDKLLKLASDEKLIKRKKTRKGVHKVKKGVTKKMRG